MPRSLAIAAALEHLGRYDEARLEYTQVLQNFALSEEDRRRVGLALDKLNREPD